MVIGEKGGRGGGGAKELSVSCFLDNYTVSTRTFL